MYRISIVGSGPAAFYTALKLLKSFQNIRIDMFEKLPVPFGLIRYGVAPDHPEVKNVISTFTQVARHVNFRFFGNVTVGKDICIKEMRKLYHGIVLAYGASQDKKLDIPGENLRQVYAASDLVGWYNGLPEKEEFEPYLNGEEAVIIGHGNVALDISRILLSKVDELKKTDIPKHVLSQLVLSKIKRIHLVGRRGPVQVAFTIKEFRELLNLESVKGQIIIPDNINLSTEMIEQLSRPKKRMMGLIVDSVRKQKMDLNYSDCKFRQWCLHFLKSPQSICDLPCSPGNVAFVRFMINTLQGDVVSESSSTFDIPCQMVVRSIGYRSLNIDPDVPFDNYRNIIPNIEGRVIELVGNESPNCLLFCVGWIKRGPVGVIVNTLTDAQETCSTILQNIEKTRSARISDDIADVFKAKGVRYLSFANWEALDKIEQSLGQIKGKPREKLTNINDMMIAATVAHNDK